MLAQSQEIERLKEVVGTILARTEREGNNHGSTSGQHSGNALSQQKDKENTSVSVRNSETGRGQIKLNKQNSRVQHSVDEGLQTKEKEGARTKGIKNDHSRVELLNWFQMGEEVVASAKLESKDPTAMVHHVPLGQECWKVWVLDVLEDIALYRPTREFGTLSMAQGSTIAWPIKYIKLV
ncbi:putative transposase, Tnp1/En/Spm [Rosa chinensis]|uniref:Putative transposase, Tnp1/En/Spm n=1 Tax=Rosa chinensis TaxID=74649 RepID=A0A2P6QHK2_ROSCH|nr:putative transposase, Tnp1/En/Spm [Rosa chinensis]